MSEDQISSRLGAFADILADPKGFELESLQCLSRGARNCISSFIQGAISSDGALMHRCLVELSNHASKANSFQAWFDLGLLAQRFFFNQGAIEYYQRAVELAGKDGKQASQALAALGSLYAEVEDWDRAEDCFQKALCSRESSDQAAALSILANLGHIHQRQGEYERALECYQKILDQAEAQDPSARGEALSRMGSVYQLQGDLTAAEGVL